MPLLLILCAVTPLVVVTPLQDQVSLPKLATNAALVGSGWLVVGLRLARARTRPEPHVGVLLAILPYAGANVLAAGLSLDPRSSIIGEYQRYQGLASQLLYLMLFGLVVLSARSLIQVKLVCWALALGALGTSVYAVIQKAGLDWVQWQGLPPGRVGSTFAQPNFLGAFLAATVPVIMALLLASRRQSRISLALLLAAVLAAILFTLSRAAWLGAGLGIALMILCAGRPQRWMGSWCRRREALTAWFLAPVLALVLILVVIGPVRATLSGSWDRLTSSGDLEETPVAARLGLWRLSFQMIGDRPLLGAGQDSLGAIFGEYRSADLPGIGSANVRPESAHNVFLDVATGTGLVGLAAFVLLLGAVGAVQVRFYRAATNTDVRLLSAGLLVGAASYLAALFFGYAEATSTWVLWVLVGLGVAAAKSGSSPGTSAQMPPRLWAAVGLSSAVAGLVFIVGSAVWLWADVSAGQAQDAARAGDYQDAVRLAQRATLFNPAQRRYLVQLAQYREALALSSADPIPGLTAAANDYHAANGLFHPEAHSTLLEASALAKMSVLGHVPPSGVSRLVESAVRLDPNNISVRRQAAAIYESLGRSRAANTHLLEAARLADFRQ